MFYSHDVLTSRKYGVATVWLVATLGSKSTLKKVSRKAILNVDVAKACETIIAPEAPMALRLQSSLLRYGVTRVYSQQCGYVLTDVESARNNLRAISKVMRQAELEAEGANKARKGQLQLQDDPDFVPDFFMSDPEALNSGLNEEIQAYSQSPRRSQSVTNGSQQSIGGLMIPTSNSSLIGGPVGGMDLFSVRGDSGAGSTRVPAQLLDDDDLGLDMGFDLDLPVAGDLPSRTQARASINMSEPSARGSQGRHMSNEQPGQPMLEHYHDDFIPPADDYNDIAADVDRDQSHHETTSETATAANARKARVAKKKVIDMDSHTSMANRELAELNRTYLSRMLDEGAKSKQKKLNAIAKKNAEHWVLGAGSILAQGMRGPLDMFSGASIIEAFTGINLLTGKKRAHEDEPQSNDSRTKRSRVGPPSDEVSRAEEYQGADDFMMMGDDTIEQGREAPTPLDDRHISSLLPWNQSQGSRRPTEVHQPTSGSFGGGPQLTVLSRRGSRLTSASPLGNRGIPAQDIDDFELPPDPDMQMGGMDDDEQFQLYGTAAQVDTQTAAQTQWQLAALTGESANFLDFVQAAIEESDDLDQAGKIEFEKLLPPESNSYVVAAQALLHVLTLGTRGALQVEQNEACGPIVLGVAAHVL